jgi:opacity protein-like surface antigen
MKPILASLAACLCLVVAAAQAQTMQPIKIQQLQPATNVGQVAQVDQAALEKAKLERENKRLREENAALKKQVDDFTALGGSNVHAYCANETTSRNTSGAEQACGANLKCDQVTGLCKTACTTTSDCAVGACEICGSDTQGICTTTGTGRCD